MTLQQIKSAEIGAFLAMAKGWNSAAEVRQRPDIRVSMVLGLILDDRSGSTEVQVLEILTCMPTLGIQVIGALKMR